MIYVQYIWFAYMNGSFFCGLNAGECTSPIDTMNAVLL